MDRNDSPSRVAGRFLNGDKIQEVSKSLGG